MTPTVDPVWPISVKEALRAIKTYMNRNGLRGPLERPGNGGLLVLTRTGLDEILTDNEACGGR